MLVTRLPVDSWTQTELRDNAPPTVVVEGPPKFGPWALVNYQLAQLLDSIHHLEYATVVMAGGKPPEPPAPVPKPGASNVRQMRTPEEIAYLESLRAKGA